MAKKLQLRGGTTAEHATFTGAIREVTVDTDKDILVVHDGATAGGFPQNAMGAASSTTVSGTVETSTSAENVTGTSDVVTPTVAGVKELIDTHSPATPVSSVTVTGTVETSTSAENVTGTATTTPTVAGVKEMVDTHAGDLLASNNLSDVTAATALTNIGGIGAATTDTLTNKTIGAFSLNSTPGADHTAVGPQTNTLASGYNSAVMDLVYLGSASKWLEADADASGTSINLLGIALEAKTDTQAMVVALSGSFVRDDTWAWTPGVPLYISGTEGEITATKPTGSGDIVRTVGYAVTADIIFFAPSSDYVTLA